MIYARITAIVGLLLVLLPFLGFPTSWKTFFSVIAGIVLLYVGYKEYRSIEGARRRKEEKTKTYTESTPTGISSEIQ